MAACFAHVRRRFYELHVNESSRRVTEDVATMGGLWEIMAKIGGLDPERRMKARREKSASIVAALFDLVGHGAAAPMAEALYATSPSSAS
nr:MULTISPECIES: transposase [unclassified Bradyrhizobium]